MKIKKRLSSLLILLCVLLMLSSCSIQSVDDYYSSSSDSDSGIYATISIDCKTILDNYDMLDENLKNERYVPKDGIIVEETKYAIDETIPPFQSCKKR